MAKRHRFPHHINENLNKDPNYYSFDIVENIERSRVDNDYMGDIIVANEDLIWFTVHKYIGHPNTITDINIIERDDILQLGRMALIKSINAFDPSRGNKFSTFAVVAIYREVRRFLREKGTIIRPTSTAVNLIQGIYRIERSLGYTPTAEKIAEMLDEDIDKVEKALQVGGKVIYYDAFTTDTDTFELGEEPLNELMVTDDEAIDAVYIDSIIHSIRDSIADIDEQIVRKLLKGYNQSQTAKLLGLSPYKVSRTVSRVANLIRELEED